MAKRLTLEEGMAALVEVERTYPVAEWRVGDTRVWPFVRVRVGYGIEAAVFDLPYASYDRVGGMVPKTAKKARTALATLRSKGEASRRRVPGRDDAVFLSDGVSLLPLDGVTYERYCDPIREELERAGHRTLLLVPGPSPGPFRQPAHAVQPSLDRAKLRGLFHAPRLSVSLPGYDDVVADLGRVGLGAFVPSRRVVRLGASALLSTSHLFARLLTDAGARAGFVVDYYKLESMAFVHACARVGIPSIDIQHGIQGPYHAAYGQWAAVPDRGYELVPRWFWVWSAEEARHIDAWRPVDNHEPIVGGNPFMRKLLQDAGPAARAVTETAGALPAADPGGLVVLVTLHGFETAGDLDELARVVAQGPGTWRWWVRAHPGHPDGADAAAAAFASHGVTNAEMQRASTAPLFALLPRVDVHVTVCSSVVIDAAAFGVPSVVLGPEGAARYAHEYRAGLVEQASPTGIVAVAGRLAASHRRRAPTVVEGGIAWAVAMLEQRERAG